MAETIKTDEGQAAGSRAGLEDDLRFERAKCDVLLNEVIALEDELANRDLAQYGEVISDSTRDFWREQLLTNRGPATQALKELAAGRKGGAGDGAGPADGGARRPLHNRTQVRAPASVATGAGAGARGEPENRAAMIRNRAHEIAQGSGLGFAAAFRRAEKEMVR